MAELVFGIAHVKSGVVSDGGAKAELGDLTPGRVVTHDPCPETNTDWYYTHAATQSSDRFHGQMKNYLKIYIVYNNVSNLNIFI